MLWDLFNAPNINDDPARNGKGYLIYRCVKTIPTCKTLDMTIQMRLYNIVRVEGLNTFGSARLFGLTNEKIQFLH